MFDKTPTQLAVEIPEDIICPITHQIMTDPVMLVESGHTYEREAILKHLSTKQTDPLTNQVIVNSAVAPNHTVKKLITSFLAKQHAINPNIHQETYLPESLIQILLSAMEKNDLVLFKDTLKKDARLLVNELKENKTIFMLACELAPLEILEAVVEQLGEKLKQRQNSVMDNAMATFLMVSRRLGIKGAVCIANGMGWDSSNFQSMLLHFIQQNDPAMTEMALLLGAIATPQLLNQAYDENKMDIVQQLLLSGVRVEDLLLRAIGDNQETLIQFLLTGSKLLVDPNLSGPNGQPPLLLAISKNQLKTVSLLLAVPTLNVMQTDQKGNTALHYAAMAGNKEIAKLCMKRGLSIKTQNKEYKTAVQLARGNHGEDLANWMEERHQYKKIKPFLIPLKRTLEEQTQLIQSQKMEMAEREKHLQQGIALLTQENQQLQEELRILKANRIQQTAILEKLSLFSEQYAQPLKTVAEKAQQTENRRQKKLQDIEIGKQNPLQEPLVERLLKGDLEGVRKLESEGASLLYPNKAGLYPLAAAVYSTNLELVCYMERRLKEEALNQWKEIDPIQAEKYIEAARPTELTGDNVADLGLWYGKHKGRVWEIIYNRECVKKEGVKGWSAGWEGLKEREANIKREQMQSLYNKRRQWTDIYMDVSLEQEDYRTEKARSLMRWPSEKVHTEVVQLIHSQLDELKKEVENKVNQASNFYLEKTTGFSTYPANFFQMNQVANTAIYSTTAGSISATSPTTTGIIKTRTLVPREEELQEQLISALLKEDLALVNKLESEGASFYEPNKEEIYPLAAAVYSTNLKLVQYVKGKLKEASAEQWAKVDAQKAYENIRKVGFFENMTIGDLGRWYGKNKDKAWCAEYDQICLQSEKCGAWSWGDWKQREAACISPEYAEKKFQEVAIRDNAWKSLRGLYWPSVSTHAKAIKLVLGEQLEQLEREVETETKQPAMQALKC